MFFRSIRWRIAIPFIIFFLLTMIGMGAYLTNQVKLAQQEELQKDLLSEAHLLIELLHDTPFVEANIQQLDQFAKQYGEILGVRVTLIALNGKVLGESEFDRSQMDNHGSRPEVLEALESGQGSSIRYSQTLEFDTLYVAIPLIQEGEHRGFVRLSLPLKEIEARITQLRQTIYAAMIGATIFILLIAIIIAQRTTRPLRELTEASQHIARGDMSIRLVTSTRDEVGDLSRAMNLMTNKLQQQINALETERGKLAAVLRQMTNGVVMVDPGGRIQLLNTAAEQMFGAHETDAIGKTLVEVLRHHQLVEIWQNCFDLEEMQVLSIELPQKELYLQVIATPLGDLLAGHTLLIFQDHTRVRKLETVRRDFISNISHELRTPLASLKALTETLMNGALDDPPAARRFLTRIETEVDALSMIVQELLELSRIESGRVPLQFIQVDPCLLLNEAYERLHLQAERADLSIQIDCPPNLPAVLADPPRIEQAVINLLHNAIKFTPVGGSIFLRAYLDFQSQQVVFQVEDTGVGIPEEDLPRIFERFFKTDRSRSGGGTGLGLAISRHIIENHRGRIWVESEEQKGSTFYFTLMAEEWANSQI
jgi:two-component system phosphate regulon sensor histidine kinase PhoR